MTPAMKPSVANVFKASEVAAAVATLRLYSVSFLYRSIIFIVYHLLIITTNRQPPSFLLQIHRLSVRTRNHHQFWTGRIVI